MTNNCANFRLKTPIPCWDINKTRQGITFICRTLYTDGSKMNNLTAAAAVGRDVSKSLRINSQASIFTAELVALNLYLDIVRRSKRKKLPSSRIRYQVFWRLIAVILKQVMMCRNLSQITASYQTLEKPLF